MNDNQLSIGGELFFLLSGEMRDYVFKVYKPLAGGLFELATTLVTLYLIFAGYRLMTGRAAGEERSLVISMLVIAIVYQATFYVGLLEFIYEPLVKTPIKLMSFLVSLTGSGGTVEFMNDIDKSFAVLFDKINRLGANASKWDLGIQIKVTFAVLFLTLAFGAVYLIFFALLCVAMFGLHVQLVLTPIIGMFAAFKPTRFIFASWLRDVMTWALFPVFAGIVMAICMAIISRAIEGFAALSIDNGDVFTRQYAAAALAGVLSAYFLYKVPQFAAALTGGQSSGFAGLTQTAATLTGLAAVGTLAATRGMDNFLKTAREQGLRNATIGALQRIPGSGIAGAGIAGAGRAYSAARGFMNGMKRD